MKITTVFFALLFLSTTIFCQPKLLKDINIGTGASLVNVDNAVIKVGAFVFFAASQPDLGAELWKTDGTTDGTQLVKDIQPGSAGSRLNNFYALGNDLLLFTADDGVNGLELWRSDGTETGTFMVKNIGPGVADGISNFINNPQYYIVFNSKLYFGANNGVNGQELWSSDGTESGTMMVKDIFTNTTGSSPTNFEVHNGSLFFSASGSAQGAELWKSDGTSAGTVLVKDIRPGGFGSNPANLRSLGSTLILTANDGVHDIELWKTDGTSAGTVLVKDIKTNSAGTFGTSSFETGTNSYENRFARLGDIAFFSAIDDSTGIELWKTDGTEAGTIRVKDASSAAGANGYAPQNFTVLGDEIYYKYDNNISGIELWKSDGTEAGTHIVKDLEPGFFGSFVLPTYIFSHLDKLYFASDAGFNGIELFESDGTEAGTKLFANLNPGSASSSPNRFISLGKRLIFWATTTNNGAEPWIYIPPITVNAIVSDAMCFGDSTGAASLHISPDGIAPFNTDWEPNWVSGIEPSNLSAGMYSVTVTDSEGATGSATITIGQPNALSFIVTTTPETGTAANGTATVNPTGGAPNYTYLWNTTPPQTTQTATGLIAGDYTCTLSDANGCTTIATTTVLQISGTSETANDPIQFKIHPNPANAIAYWLKPDGKVVSGRIFQQNGQVIRLLTPNELKEGQLDTSSLPNGGYTIMLVLETGQLAFARFVIAR